jgi:hypothetical protein
MALILFLRGAGAPVDHNLVEGLSKRAILHRKNSLFFKTVNGAHRVAAARTGTQAEPDGWMPRNYRDTLARLATLFAASYDESCLAEKDRRRPAGSIARKWSGNGLFTR